MYKTNIHYFRGITIILVVFSHCYFCGLSTFGQNENILFKIFRSIVSGGSAFFVFISGSLFTTIYKSNKSYFLFLLKKIKFVYLPFLVFSSLDLVYILLKIIFIFFNSSNKLYFFTDALVNFDFISVYFIGKSIITNGILWYIPFVMVIYLLSPIFLIYSKLRINYQITILASSLIVSLFIFRAQTLDFLSVFHNLIYFLPFYLLGIFFSRFEDFLYKKVNIKFILFLILLSFLFSINNFQKFLFLKSIDLILIQKLLLCITFMVYFNNTTHKSLEILNIFATNSFGIFFVHSLILFLIRPLTFFTNVSYRSQSFILYLITATIVLTISLFVVIIIKRLLGHSSKYIIGV